MIYIDGSCLVTLVVADDQSRAVAKKVAQEESVLVSSLAELEVLVQLKNGFMGGLYGLARLRQFELQLDILRNKEPFIFRNVSNGIWEIALRQHRNSRDTHCRTLDRLHLAAAEKFGITRLMTRDLAQARAAEELGFEVVET